MDGLRFVNLEGMYIIISQGVHIINLNSNYIQHTIGAETMKVNFDFVKDVYPILKAKPKVIKIQFKEGFFYGQKFTVTYWW